MHYIDAGTRQVVLKNALLYVVAKRIPLILNPAYNGEDKINSTAFLQAIA
jgi:hypothetical protein